MINYWRQRSGIWERFSFSFTKNDFSPSYSEDLGVGGWNLSEVEREQIQEALD